MLVISSTEKRIDNDYKRKIVANLAQFIKEEDSTTTLDKSEWQTKVEEKPKEIDDEGFYAKYRKMKGLTLDNFENFEEKLDEEKIDSVIRGQFMRKVTRAEAPQIFKKPVKSKHFRSLLSLGFDCEKKIPESVDESKKNAYQTLVDCYTRTVYYNHGVQKDIEQALKLITFFSKEELEYIECSGLSRSIQHKPQRQRDMAKADKENSPKTQMLKIFKYAKENQTISDTFLSTTENNPLDDMLNDPEVNSKHISILTFKFTNEKKILQNISDIYYKI